MARDHVGVLKLNTMDNVKFITKIGVIDPETNDEHWMDVYIDATGLIVGIDSHFLAYSNNGIIKSPYGNDDIIIEE